MVNTVVNPAFCRQMQEDWESRVRSQPWLHSEILLKNKNKQKRPCFRNHSPNHVQNPNLTSRKERKRKEVLGEKGEGKETILGINFGKILVVLRYRQAKKYISPSPQFSTKFPFASKTQTHAREKGTCNIAEAKSWNQSRALKDIWRTARKANVTDSGPIKPPSHYSLVFSWGQWAAVFPLIHVRVLSIVENARIWISKKKSKSIPAGKWGYLQKNKSQCVLKTLNRQLNQVVNPVPAKSLRTCRANRISFFHVHGFRNSVTPYYLHLFFICVSAHEHMEVTGQLVGIHSLLPHCEGQELNSGHRAWPEPLPSETFQCPILMSYCSLITNTNTWFVLKQGLI